MHAWLPRTLTASILSLRLDMVTSPLQDATTTVSKPGEQRNLCTSVYTLGCMVTFAFVMLPSATRALSQLLMQPTTYAPVS